MKKIVKTLTVLLVFVLGLGLTACNKNSLTMPKPKGKVVQYNNFELEKKYDKLKFENKKDKLIQASRTLNIHEEDIDYNYEQTQEYTMVKDTNTNDLWLNLKHSYSESDGKYKIAVNGYESKNYTYFDVDFTNNKKFDDEDYNIELYNGKYKIKKEEGIWYDSNSLYDLLSDYGIYFDDDLDFEDAYYYFEEDFFLELNEIGYKKLKFYETNELFTIELKITLDDLKKEKDDFYDLGNDCFNLPDNIDDLNKFDNHYVYVFENNYLIEFGYKESIQFSEYENNDDEYSKLKNDFEIIIKYTDKKPKEYKYSDYELIEDSEDIIK